MPPTRPDSHDSFDLLPGQPLTWTGLLDLAAARLADPTPTPPAAEHHAAADRRHLAQALHTQAVRIAGPAVGSRAATRPPAGMQARADLIDALGRLAAGPAGDPLTHHDRRSGHDPAGPWHRAALLVSLAGDLLATDVAPAGRPLSLAGHAHGQPLVTHDALARIAAVTAAGRTVLAATGTMHPHSTGGLLATTIAVLTGRLDRAWTPAPPAAVFWPALAVIWLLPALGVAAWVVRRIRGRAGLGGTARWAGAADERRLAVPADPAARPGRLVAGYGGTTGKLIAAEDCISAVCFGPNGSGKTTSLLAPNAVEWTGPLVVTTTKPADVHLIHTARAAKGPVWVLAPGGCPPYVVAHWSPVDYAADLAAADRMADWLIEASGMTADPKARAWHAQARKYLAPLLLAAHHTGGGIAQLISWIYDGHSAADDVTAILLARGEHDARRLYASTWTIHDEGQGSVPFTAYGIADAYARPDIAASARTTDITPSLLIDGGGTLIVVATESDADRTAGHTTALLAAIVAEAEQRATQTGGPLQPRLGLLIDEAATAFRFPRLTSLLTTARGNGIGLLLVYHDLAQLDHLYTTAGARTVLSNAKLRILLPGQGDPATLDYFSKLAGQTLVSRTGQTHAHDGKRSHSTSEQTQPLAPVHALAQLPAGQGLVLYPGVPPVRIRLRPVYADRPLRRYLHQLTHHANTNTDTAAAGTP